MPLYEATRCSNKTMFVFQADRRTLPDHRSVEATSSKIMELSFEDVNGRDQHKQLNRSSTQGSYGTWQ